MSQRDDWTVEDTLAALLLALLFLLMASCATSEALLKAPEPFWDTVVEILQAVWRDIESVILLLGL